jgi:hypothetical protein
MDKNKRERMNSDLCRRCGHDPRLPRELICGGCLDYQMRRTDLDPAKYTTWMEYYQARLAALCLQSHRPQPCRHLAIHHAGESRRTAGVIAIALWIGWRKQPRPHESPAMGRGSSRTTSRAATDEFSRQSPRLARLRVGKDEVLTTKRPRGEGHGVARGQWPDPSL